MWTDTTRAHHVRAGLALPSDLTDAEWALPGKGLEQCYKKPENGCQKE